MTKKPKLEGSIGVLPDGELNLVEKGSPRQEPTIIDDDDDPFLADDPLDEDDEDDTDLEDTE
jgi:hypothetical protein